MSEEKIPGGQPGDRDTGSLQDAHQSIQAEPNQPAYNEEEIRRRRRRRTTIWIVVAVVVILVLYLIRRSSKDTAAGASAKAKAAQAPAAITMGQSKTGDINIYVSALGTVTPTSTITVYSQITGRVMAVRYREGQMVRKGAALIDIDPRPYQATLTQAEGSLERDQGVLAQARIDLQRYKDAYARNAIAKQQLDDQEQAVVQAAGTVKADKGTVAYDQVQLDYCHIVAPVSGQVGLRLVDPGNTVFSGSSSVLVVIAQLHPITVVFNVSEDNLQQIKAQLTGKNKLPVDAFNRANDKLIESGKLTSLDNQVDTTTGTIKFRAEFPNKDLALFPNQFVNARLLVNTLRSVTLVPSAAVQHNGTNAFVYIVQPNNTVSVQQITTLNSDEQVTAVQGLNPGLNLATSGFDRLESGAQVTVRGQNAQQGGNSAGGGAAQSGGAGTSGGAQSGSAGATGGAGGGAGK
jgi:multidrug efflux system membrane fusion protein